MGDVVNLNRARKAAKKRDDKARAATNRALHGATGEERARLEAERRQARQSLDGHRLDSHRLGSHRLDGDGDGPAEAAPEDGEH